jgi:PAS domain S-box-containing protein
MLKVLLVDDDPDLLTLARLFIDKDGSIAADTCVSAAEALQRLYTSHYDAVVSDYDMPGMNGIDLLKAIRERQDRIPFIIFTGKGREEVVIEAINNGADFYLQKGGAPVAQFAELVHKIKLAVLQKQTEQNLIESEKKYKTLYSLVRLMCDNVPDLIWAKDLEGHFLFTNRAMCRKLLGATDTSEPIGHSDLFFADRERQLHPENPEWHTFGENCINSDAIIKETKKAERFDEYGLVKGELLHLDVYKAPFLDEDGQIIGTVGCGRDVTREQMIREALKESEEKYRVLVENSLDGILIQDFNGQILFVNQAIVRVLGLNDASEIIGKNSLDLVSPEYQDVAIQDLMNVSQGHDGYLREYVIRASDGQELRIEGLGTKIMFGGKPANILTIRDVTGRKRTEEALLVSKKKLNLLFDITRHDILNRIYVLSGYLELTRQQTEDPTILAYIKAQTEAISAIRQQIEFTREYENIGLYAPEWQNVRNNLTEALSYLNNGVLSVEEDLAGLEVYADPLFRKVFYNLVENSIIHGGSVRKISVFACESETGLILAYEDNGCGIPAEEKQKIFERRFGKHNGLGLFLVQEILSITGLSISETGVPGEGARFEIHIPNGQFRKARPE